MGPDYSAFPALLNLDLVTQSRHTVLETIQMNNIMLYISDNIQMA